MTPQGKKSRPKTTPAATRANDRPEALERLLVEQAERLKALELRCQEMDAELRCLRNPDNLPLSQQLIAMLLKHGKPLPNDIHEHALRLGLLDSPFEMQMTISMVALQVIQDRPPVPWTELINEAAARDDIPTEPALDELLTSAEMCWNSADAFGAFAALWQAVLRFQASGRGWAEYARYLARSGQYAAAADAVARARAATTKLDAAAFVAVAEALERIASDGTVPTEDYAKFARTGPATSAAAQIAKAALFRISGHPDKAVAAAAAALKKAPKEPASHQAAFLVGYAAGDFEHSYAALTQWIHSDPVGSVHEITRRYSSQYVSLCQQLKKEDAIPDWLGRHYDEASEITLVPSWPTPDSLLHARRTRQVAIDRGLPPALLITQGKSASVSISGIFGKGFGLPTVLYALTLLRVVKPWAVDFARGGGCYVTHLEPTFKNLELLHGAGLRRPMVNVRDPRGVLVSFMHHLTRYRGLYPADFSNAWAAKSTDERLEYLFEAELRKIVAWIQGWVDARETLDVRFSTYEQFVTDRDAFTDRLLADYGGGTTHFDRDAAFAPTPGVDYHMRKGTTDSWKSELTPAQIERINRQIPNDWWILFGWNP